MRAGPLCSLVLTSVGLAHSPQSVFDEEMHCTEVHTHPREKEYIQQERILFYMMLLSSNQGVIHSTFCTWGELEVQAPLRGLLARLGSVCGLSPQQWLGCIACGPSKVLLAHLSACHFPASLPSLPCTCLCRNRLSEVCLTSFLLTALPTPAIVNQEQFCCPGDIWESLETSLIVTTWGQGWPCVTDVQ